MSKLALLITQISTTELAGFTVAGFLLEKAAEIGTGKLWDTIRTKLDNKNDSFESRLYQAIESSVMDYLGGNANMDITAAICEQLFNIWCQEKYLTPDQVTIILRKYSEDKKQSDILSWYNCFLEKVCKDQILFNKFMIDNLQASVIMQKDSYNKINEIFDTLKKMLEHENADTNHEYPLYLSERATDINIFYINRLTFETQIWNVLVMEGTSILIHGIGGIGKTETAKAVLKKICSLPSSVTGITRVIWANYSNNCLKDTLIEAVYETKNMDQEEAWQYIHGLIQEERQKLLIVIDNIESVEDDSDLQILNDLPCRVMVTSRTEKVSGLRKFHVDSLPISDCQEIFYHYYSGEQDNYHLMKILNLAEYHTVMIELLAKTANMEEVALPKFYDMLVKRGFRISDEEVDSEHHLLQRERRIIEQLGILFQITKCRFQDRKLLCQLSVIPSLPFKYKDVKNWIEIERKSQLEYLVQTGWLQSDQAFTTKYIMHSVIASAIRFQNAEHLYNDCKSIIRNITHEMALSVHGHGTEKTYLIPFSWSISDVFANHLCDEEDSLFLSNLAEIYCDVGNFENALSCYQQALAIDIAATDPLSFSVSIDYYNIASMYYDMFQFKKALHYARKSLIIQKRKCPSDSIEITILIQLFAALYARLNRTGRAEQLFTWVSAKLETHPDEDLLIRCSHYSDMATFYRELGRPGDFENAETYYQKTENLMKMLYKDTHPELAALYDNYGLLYAHMGRYEDALKLCLKSLEIKERFLDTEHPDIVESYNNIGLQYYNLSNCEDALKNLELALDTANKIWPGPFSFKADIYSNLGLVHRDLGEYDKAKDYYDKSLEIRRNYYSEKHPLVLATFNNIAQIHASEDNHKQAIKLLENIISDYTSAQSAVEEDNSFLGTIYDNLCNSYRALKHFEKALEACEKGRSIRESIFGHDSLEYTLSLNNLGRIYYDIGEYMKAKDIFKDALNIKKEFLPDCHGQLSIGYFNLGLAYDQLHQDDKALSNYWSAMEIDNTLGNYDDVIMAAGYMANIYERNGLIKEAEKYRHMGQQV